MLAQECDSALVFHEKPRGSRGFFTEHGPHVNQRSSIRFFIARYNVSYRWSVHNYNTGIFSSRSLKSRK